jgi:pilus assembly protein CpaF
VTIRDLLHSSLRMRPDRIIIGECRGGEALDLLQAMNTGHAGSMSTLHADSPGEALKRLEILALFGGVDIPLRFLRAQVAAAISVAVQLQRLAGRRVVQSVTAVEGLDEKENYRLVELFAYDVRSGGLVRRDEAAAFLDAGSAA